MGLALASPVSAQLHAPNGWNLPSATRPSEFLVRLRPGARPEALASLATRGIHVRHAEGRPLFYSGWALVSAEPRAIPVLRAHPQVERVRRLPPPGILPLDRSAEHLGLANARGAGLPADEWTGQGVTIADMDSHVDVYHPDFFRGDAGWYDWIDSDGDGVFTPGVDAIDLSQDGTADATERGQVLSAELIDIRGRATDSLRGSGFDPAVDWVYLDVNEDRERNFGFDAGFDDDAPALGEPLFVPDDVDGDGVIGVEERFVRLGTSKFVAVYTHVEYPGLPTVDHVYRRGVDLVRTPGDITGGIRGYSDTLHASGVLGILVGGVALPSRRFVGVAPDAEVYNAFDIGSSDVGRLLWAYDQNPDVMLHEYVLWTRLALDGTDPYSELIDASADDGVVNVCPAGNIGGSAKHVEREVLEGATETLPFRIPAGMGYVSLTLHARGTGAVAAELVSPAGGTYPLRMATFEEPLGTGTLYGYGEVTLRDTTVFHAIIYMGATGTGWQVRATSSGGPVMVHGYLSDEAGFATSSAWDGATPASTIAAPATADRCIAVGSVPSHTVSEGSWYDNGGTEASFEVRDYSARGPRIDGDLRPHVVAPDNPWAPLGVGEFLPSRPGALRVNQGAYRVFGGTSGAGPHVAGVAALLVQSGLSGDAVLQRITDSAVVDPTAGEVPNDDYGFGRVHAAQALGGVVGGEPPTVSLRAEPPMVRPDGEARLVLEVAPGVQVRWDDRYDGTWETGYEAPENRTVRFPLAGLYRWKVRVRDGEGRIAEAVALLEVSETVPDAGAPTSDGGVLGDGGPGEPPMGGGCGCRVPVGGQPSPLALAGLLGLVVFQARRRRRA